MTEWRITVTTIVCRCEEVSLGQIKETLARGVTDINEIKRMTRLGMGRCQGRMCSPAAVEIAARQQDLDFTQVSNLRPRPPVKPIPLGVLAKHGVQG